jgi:hypothetical protein
MKKEECLYQAADKSGMSEKTARKYLKSASLPSQMQGVHDWSTRKDPFVEDWAEVVEMIKNNHGLEAKTVFEYLRREHPGRYQNGQLRTLQRRIKRWRATEGPAKEVYFPQIHYPGELCASDFTCMNELKITISAEAFNHLLYHFVLTYSNWEDVTLCYSESFESLSLGLQNALWRLGGIPRRHRSDRMSAAVNKACNPEHFTRRYHGLMRHYCLEPERTNARCANENGDVETSHRHFKSLVNQALMLRGSKDFATLDAYETFLRELVNQRNAGRSLRFQDEQSCLRQLPRMRLDDHKSIDVTVGSGSTIYVAVNTYSVHSRLIGEKVHVRIYGDYLEVWYAQKVVERLPRLRGRSKHRINYRHIIDWLVRKPGAFKNYRYQADLFPSSWFRIVFDWLRSRMPLSAHKEYVRILAIAAGEGETITENAIRYLIERNEDPTASRIEGLVKEKQKIPDPTEVRVSITHLTSYDVLLEGVACHG